MARIGLTNIWYSHLTEGEDGTATYDDSTHTLYLDNAQLGRYENSLYGSSHIFYQETEALTVCLVAGALHREPGHILAVGRELGIEVVTIVQANILFRVDGLELHRLGGIDSLMFEVERHLITATDTKLPSLAKILRMLNVIEVASFHIIKVDVGVGADAVFETRLSAAGESNELRVRTPNQLFNATEGFHLAFVGFAFKNVEHLSALNVENKGVGDTFHIMIPMAIH